MEKELKNRVKQLVKNRDSKDFVNCYRERWTDEEVVQVYQWARKLEARKWKNSGKNT